MRTDIGVKGDMMEEVKIPNVYMASKMHHAHMLRELYLERPDIHFTNRWIWLEDNVPDTSKYARNFWVDDHADVLMADCVIVYGGKDDTLKGALVEAGIAIGNGMKVHIVGDSVSFGTWQHHPLVRRFETIDDALSALFPPPQINEKPNDLP